MKRPEALLLAAVLLSGCSSPGQPMDPFFGRTTVPPPATGVATAAANPYRPAAPGNLPAVAATPANPSAPAGPASPTVAAPPGTPTASALTAAPATQPSSPSAFVPGPTNSLQANPTPAAPSGYGNWNANPYGTSAGRSGPLPVGGRPPRPRYGDRTQAQPVSDPNRAPAGAAMPQPQGALPTTAAPGSSSNPTARPDSSAGSRYPGSTWSPPNPAYGSASAGAGTAATASPSNSGNSPRFLQIIQPRPGESGSVPQPTYAPATPSPAYQPGYQPAYPPSNNSPSRSVAPGGVIDIMDLPDARKRSSLDRGRAAAEPIQLASAEEKSSGVLVRPLPIDIESATAQAAAASGSDSKLYGSGADFAWLRGKLDYVAAEKTWKLRYSVHENPADPLGGSVRIANPSALSGLERGEYVEVKGKLKQASAGSGDAASTYEVTEVRRQDES